VSWRGGGGAVHTFQTIFIFFTNTNEKHPKQSTPTPHINRTTLSSKLLTHDKDYFATIAVDAVMRLNKSGNLDHIRIIKKPGGE